MLLQGGRRPLHLHTAEQGLHGTAWHSRQRLSSDFGLFGFSFPLPTVLHLQAQPQHPTAWALGRVPGVSSAAFESQSS